MPARLRVSPAVPGCLGCVPVFCVLLFWIAVIWAVFHFALKYW